MVYVDIRDFTQWPDLLHHWPVGRVVVQEWGTGQKQVRECITAWGQQLRDVTPAEGGKILSAAEGMEGTPYKYGGNDGKKGIDCIHMVCAALNEAGVKARANANANDFQKDVNMRPLGPKEQPRTGDIVRWKHQPTGHVGVYDANPPKPGYNIYSATNHGVIHAPASWFSSLGTPTYYRVEVPQ
jgi:hypothetical protein